MMYVIAYVCVNVSFFFLVIIFIACCCSAILHIWTLDLVGVHVKFKIWSRFFWETIDSTQLITLTSKLVLLLWWRKIWFILSLFLLYNSGRSLLYNIFLSAIGCCSHLVNCMHICLPTQTEVAYIIDTKYGNKSLQDSSSAA